MSRRVRTRFRAHWIPFLYGVRGGGPCRAFSTGTVLAPGTSVKRQRVGPCCLADRAVPAPLLKNGEPPRARKTMGNWAWGGGAGGSCGVCHQAGVQAPPARGMADWPGQDRGRDSLPDHRGFACCCSAEKYPTHRGARSTAVLHPLRVSWVQKSIAVVCASCRG